MPGPSGEDSATAFSAEPRFGDDAALVARIIDAYRHAAATFEGHGDSMWAPDGYFLGRTLMTLSLVSFAQPMPRTIMTL
jgi:hypothetical protein